MTSCCNVNNYEKGTIIITYDADGAKLKREFLNSTNNVSKVTCFLELNQYESTSSTEYRERISYDPNGSILTYQRNADATRSGMDNLTYSYKPNTNQVHKVVDITADASAANYPKYNDIRTGQLDNNYVYDAIGNLIQDVKDTITNITWNVYGKIESITQNAKVIRYTYDAAGNRIIKATTADTTYYVRDASGNVLSVYRKPAAGPINQEEVHLYGSSRLGIVTRHLVPDSSFALANSFGKIYSYKFTRGEKLFELSNHLGNVLVTLSDRVQQVKVTSDTVRHYLADIRSANDYYPFGMLMPGRKFNAGSFRHGFNGKENDNEVKGIGNQQDYGMRIYDPRLGKFLSVDPLSEDYPWNSVYAFAENDVIRSIDLDGLEKYIINTNRNVDPKTKETTTSRHLFINPNESQHNRGLIGHYDADNKFSIINDPNLLSEFDRKVYDYSMEIMKQKNIVGGSMRMPNDVDIKLKVVEVKKVGTNEKPKPKIEEKPIAEDASYSGGIFMKPNGISGTPNRNKYAANTIFKPEVDKLISSIRLKSKDINRIEINIEITTNYSNKTNISDIQNEIQMLFPKAKIKINLDPNYRINPSGGNKPSNEDFKFKIKVSGYGKKR